MSDVWVVTHDCQRDTHDCRVIGPFPDRAEAWAFIDRHDLEHPLDGGYAFAAVLPPDVDEGHGDPAKWDAELAEALADDEE